MSDKDDSGSTDGGKGQHAKPHGPFVPPGAESTRELREMARRRREAEEKLQHHLQEAKDKPAED